MAKRHRKNQNRGRVRQPQFRVNEFIRIPEIRLVGDNLGVVGERVGKKIEPGIYSSRQAKEWARAMDLDLVEISPNAKPPVCKIMDYGKYKYERDKKLKEAKKKQHNADVKEVKMRYKIEEHDYNVRVKNAQRFLKSGDKVKATVSFRGREIQHSNLAIDLLKRMAADLEDFAEVQQAPKREGRNMMMMLSPKK